MQVLNKMLGQEIAVLGHVVDRWRERFSDVSDGSLESLAGAIMNAVPWGAQYERDKAMFLLSERYDAAFVTQQVRGVREIVTVLTKPQAIANMQRAGIRVIADDCSPKAISIAAKSSAEARRLLNGKAYPPDDFAVVKRDAAEWPLGHTHKISAADKLLAEIGELGLLSSKTEDELADFETRACALSGELTDEHRLRKHRAKINVALQAIQQARGRSKTIQRHKAHADRMAQDARSLKLAIHEMLSDELAGQILTRAKAIREELLAQQAREQPAAPAAA